MGQNQFLSAGLGGQDVWPATAIEVDVPNLLRSELEKLLCAKTFAKKL